MAERGGLWPIPFKEEGKPTLSHTRKNAAK